MFFMQELALRLPLREGAEGHQIDRSSKSPVGIKREGNVGTEDSGVPPFIPDSSKGMFQIV